MGLFDKLLVQEENPDESVKGGTREVVEAQKNVPNYDEKVNISGNAAADILKNAMAPLDEKTTTIYTLKDLVSTLPAGVKKESILGVLTVTKVSAEEIQKDAQERLSILDSVEEKLKAKIGSDIQQFEAEIKEATERIEENRKKKADAEALLRDYQLLRSKTRDEINSILATIN